jgi:hypothetical protein
MPQHILQGLVETVLTAQLFNYNLKSELQTSIFAACDDPAAPVPKGNTATNKDRVTTKCISLGLGCALSWSTVRPWRGHFVFRDFTFIVSGSL